MHEFDVVVIGAGIGGISSAVSAARCGARTLLVESHPELGGTGVYSPLGIVCGLGPKHDHWVNEGVLQDFFPHLWEGERYPGQLPYYDAKELAARYRQVTAAEPNLTVWTGTRVESVITRPGHEIQSVRLEGEHSCGVTGHVFIDGTANGNLSAMAGADFQLGRELDGKLQPCTLTFTVRNVDVDQLGLEPTVGRDFVVRDNEDKKLLANALGLDAAWQRLKAEGGTSNPKTQDWVLFFPSRDGRTLVFNHTRVTGINPLDPEDVARGRALAEQQIWEFWNQVSPHPALADAQLEISPELGVREGRRILGDYVLTREDCLGEARFEDMVAACAYSIDIHHPDGAGTDLVEIPGSGYYHLPYRSLRARGWRNLLLGSRCLSGTHEAHSSYRVMAPLSAVGQACGVAAALASLLGLRDVREVRAAQIRSILHQQGQFTEGELEYVEWPSSRWTVKELA